MTKRLKYDGVSEVCEAGLTMGRGVFPGNVKFADDRMNTVDQAGAFLGNRKHWHQIADLPANPDKYLTDLVAELKERIRGSITLPQTGRKRKRRRRLDAGDELDPQAWLQRDPDGWEAVQKVSAERKQVRIGVNATVNALDSLESLAARGAAVAALAEILTELGASVEVVAFDCGAGMSPDLPKYVCEVVAKPMNAPLDEGALIVACGDAGFYRLAVLNAVTRDHCKEQVCYGLGRAMRVPADVVAEYDLVADRDVADVNSAVRFVEQHMAALQS